LSQSQSAISSGSSTGRIALVVGIIGLVLGASGLGYAVYLGQSQLPSQLSTAVVNVTPSGKNIRIEWTTAFDAGQDRFEPQYITVAQGDNLNITLITNDTSDAHTFTIGLALRGLTGTTAQFVLNNSWIGLSSGPYLTSKNANFTGKPTGCTDNTGNALNGNGVCDTKKAGLGTGKDHTDTGPTGACNNTATTPPDCDLWSTGVLGVVTVPGVYRFFCFYHQKAGMFGYLIVLPNSAYKP
jgi:plastocyanin